MLLELNLAEVQSALKSTDKEGKGVCPFLQGEMWP